MNAESTKRVKDYVAFVSYAREDSDWAVRLVTELKRHGIKAWFDRDDLLPGQDWELEIEKGIEASRFFLALLSNNSVSKQGVVQEEVKRAMARLDRYPEGSTYVVPIRIDDCKPAHAGLKKLQWLDLVEDWDGGIRKLLEVLNDGAGAESSEVDLHLRQHLGRFRHAILGPVQGLVSAARLLASIARDAGASAAEVDQISGQVSLEAELIRLWRENQAVYLGSARGLSLRRQRVRPVVERVIARFRPSIVEGGNVIRLVWRTDLTLYCRFDSDVLDLMLSNLLDNARKYSFPNRPIEVGVEREGDILRIWVEDTGHGFQVDTLRTLGEPLSAEISVDLAMHGGGLGLRVVRSLATAQGGALFCESWPLTEGDLTGTTPHQVRFVVTMQCVRQA